MRRALHILSTALITAGIVIAADVALTLLWKEPLSTVYGSIQQGEAEDSLQRVTRDFRASVDSSPGSGGAVSKGEARRLAAAFAEQIDTGQGIGRLRIPGIDLEAVVVEGTDTATLRKGPGRYPETAFPGQGRTIGIAGHRTTYLAPFRDIDEIEDGDEVVLEMPYATFTYEVQEHEIVEPSQVEVVEDVGYERLVLTACHPLYSAAQRWVVFARLQAVER